MASPCQHDKGILGAVGVVGLRLPVLHFLHNLQLPELFAQVVADEGDGRHAQVAAKVLPQAHERHAGLQDGGQRCHTLIRVQHDECDLQLPEGLPGPPPGVVVHVLLAGPHPMHHQTEVPQPAAPWFRQTQEQLGRQVVVVQAEGVQPTQRG